MKLRIWRAWGVHIYTALGAPLALIGLISSSIYAFKIAFACMAISTFIDSTDGYLARKYHVKRHLPNFDGARLDDIIDYLNFVIVPIFMAWFAGLLPGGIWGPIVASAPLMASGYGFSNTAAKTKDHYFTGFPSYWNVVIFYLYELEWPIWVNTSILIFLSIMVFVPLKFLYSSRNKNLQKLTIGLGSVWAVMVSYTFYLLPEKPLLLIYASLYFPIYYVLASLFLQFRKPAKKWFKGK